MKVLQVLYSGLGGHGSVVTSLINADREKKWEHCLLFYGIEELLPAYQDFCKRENIPFSFVKKRKGFFHAGSKAVKAALKEHSPDVIILHSPNFIFFTLWRYCRRNKKKIFVVEHTSNDIKGFGEKINGLFSLLMARKVVYLSSFYQRQMQRKFWFFPIKKRSVVIQNGIDLEKFKPVTKTRDGNELHAGMIGRFIYPKRQALLVGALEKSMQAGAVHKELVIHFAGNGGSEVDLREEVKKKGLQDRVIFHGLLNEDEIISFLKGLDFYIHASDAEAMCTAVMQAMACGLPVVASNIPGINNIVQKNENALLFDNSNLDGMLKLLAMLQNDSKRNEIGANARKWAENYFSSMDTFSKYNQLLQDNFS